MRTKRRSSKEIDSRDSFLDKEGALGRTIAGAELRSSSSSSLDEHPLDELDDEDPLDDPDDDEDDEPGSTALAGRANATWFKYIEISEI